MNYKYLFLGVVSLAALSCVREPATDSGICPGREPEAVADDGSVVSGWIRIKLQEDAAPLKVGVFTRGEADSGNPELDRAAAALGATEIRRSFSDGGRFAERRRRYGFHLWYDIRFDEDVPVSRAQDGISSLPGVAHVQPIYRIVPLDNGRGIPGEMVYRPAAIGAARPSDEPFDDPGLPQQWHYNNEGSIRRAVEGADIDLFEAWKTTAGDPAVIVAIMDGGVQWDHPDLAANMWVNEAELNGVPGVDDDGNGYVDYIYGWNTMRESGEIAPNSHGTHVAGTVGAVNNNGIGVCGVAGGTGEGDGVRLMSCQVFDTVESGKGAEAYLYAADNGAVISQNSWVYNNMAVLPQDMSDAFDYFIENAGMDDTDGDGVNDVQTGPMAGGILIFAGGNNDSSAIQQPAADPRTVAVTAMGPDYTKAGYSNYGVMADIYAPGGADGNDTSYPRECQVYSTDFGGGYVYMSGTSMACPHVSGVAALIVSHYGVGHSDFTAEQLKERLLRSYRPVSEYVGAKYDGKLGVGLIDAGLIFLENPESVPGEITSPEAEAVLNGLRLSWLVPADGNGMAVAGFTVTYTGRGVGKFADREEVSEELSFSNYAEAGDRVLYTVEGRYNTEYELLVSAVDRFGNVSNAVAIACTTGDYANEKPRITERFGNIKIAEAGAASSVRFVLSDYFSDPNLADGDVLAYSITNRYEHIVRTTLEEGNVLVLEPLARGTANVTVLATDLDGEVAQSAMTVIIENGPDPSDKPDEPSVEGFALYPNPVADLLQVHLGQAAGDSMEFAVYDAAARKVIGGHLDFDAQGVAELDVSALAPGVYTFVGDGEPDTWRGTFLKR